ncbi:MAG TPA: HD domain-containing protein [Acidimicrobiia bacterium]|nr:HD domain-containing protein [Acidimicrobiia bacterium]
MRRPRLNIRWSLVLFPVLAVAMAAVTVERVLSDPWDVLVAAAALGVGMQFRVPASSGNPFATGLAVGAAAPIFFRLESGERLTDLAAVLVVYSLGLLLGWLLLLARNDQMLASAMLRRLVGLTAYAMTYSFVRDLEAVAYVEDEWRVVPPLIAGAAVWLLVEAAFWMQIRFGPREFSRRYLARALVGDLNVFVGLIATGALFALAYRSIGLWALGVAGLPYLFAHSAFRRFQTIRSTYRQTIRALARIPEVAGLGTDGHADRTAGLALSVGKDLGLSRADLDDLEYAALMHDIGRITLTEPAILRVGYTDDDIARWGAEIISQAPYLETIADHVRRLHEPYRKPGEQVDPSISVISKVVRATSAYDHLVAERQLSALQAVEVLHQGAAYDFDPTVVTSLRRTLERSKAFQPGSNHPSRLPALPGSD